MANVADLGEVTRVFLLVTERVRRFIDLAIERLGEAGQYSLTEAESMRIQEQYQC